MTENHVVEIRQDQPAANAAPPSYLERNRWLAALLLAAAAAMACLVARSVLQPIADDVSPQRAFGSALVDWLGYIGSALCVVTAVTASFGAMLCDTLSARIFVRFVQVAAPVALVWGLLRHYGFLR